MPKSKRSKVVALTKTKADRKALKEGLVDTVRSSVDKYKNIFIVSFENLRSTLFKDLRRDWADDSRFILGKNKVMQVALGADESAEYRDNLSLLAQCISGNVAMLFTDKTVDEVKTYFDNYAELDYARGGAVADATVVLTPEEFSEATMTHTMLEPLKKLGLRVELSHGVLVLEEPFTICTEGDILTPEQARLLVGPVLLPNSIEVSVHNCPKLVQSELGLILPAHKGALAGAKIIATAQRAALDLVSTGPDVEAEKDALLEKFVSWASPLCKALTVDDYWADYIDPCSGMPGLSCRGSTTFSEVDSFEHLLGYKTSNAGCCKVLHHPVWGSGVYPASVVTNAPLDMIVAALGLGECGAPAAASPNEGLPALASDA